VEEDFLAVEAARGSVGIPEEKGVLDKQDGASPLEGGMRIEKLVGKDQGD